MTSPATTIMNKGATKEPRWLLRVVSGQKKKGKASRKAISEPIPANSPPWSRFDIARNPNRTPWPKHQGPPTGPEKAREPTDRHSGASRVPSGLRLPPNAKFQGKAGLAPPRDVRGTEERMMPSPFSSGVPARAPFRPANSRTEDLSPETQDNLTSANSGSSRFILAPKREAKTVKPDALRYEPTEYKNPVTSKYLVAKERFRPTCKKDWSAPQTLSRENWLPRNTLNPRLVKDSQEDVQKTPSTSADPRNAMYKLNLPATEADTDSPTQVEAETRGDRPLKDKTPDDKAKAENPPPDAETKQKPAKPPIKSAKRARQDALRRRELIERRRKYLCVRHGVDPDARRHEHEEAIQAALDEFIQRYDFKATRREARITTPRGKKRKAFAKVARKAARHREEARQQALRLAGAILGPRDGSA